MKMIFHTTFFVFLTTSISATASAPKQPSGSEPIAVSVDINLTAPRRPYPQLAAEIEISEKRREHISVHLYSNLTATFKQELERGRKEITGVIKTFFQTFDDPTVVTHQPHSSFAETSEIDVQVVENGGALNPAVGQRVSALEQYRESFANKSHADGISFLKAVTDRIVLVLRQSLENQMRPLLQYKKQALIELHEENSLQRRCQELNSFVRHKLNCSKENQRRSLNLASFLEVPKPPRFGGSVPVMRLVDELQKRRDVSEDLATNQRVYAALRLAREELQIIEDSLSATVAGVLEQYRDVIKILLSEYVSK